MRYQNLKFEDIDFDTDNISLMIKATDELIKITNNIRKEKGYTDLVAWNDDNEVYYNFYLACYPATKKTCIYAICNHGEFDDFGSYDLPMTKEEKEDVLFQLIAELIMQEQNYE